MIMRVHFGLSNEFDHQYIDDTFRSSRSGRAELNAFITKDISLTVMDVLWLAIAYGKVNRRPEAIESNS